MCKDVTVIYSFSLDVEYAVIAETGIIEMPAVSHSLIRFHSFFPVKPGFVGSRRAACTEMPLLSPWMGSTSLSHVQTTVGGMVIASLESASVIWDTQVQN